MKKIASVLPFILLSLFLTAPPQSNIETEGIRFFEGTWEQALQKSAKENKLIFLDLSTSWCGWCKKMKQNIYSQKKVGDYFNEHFISVELDGEHDEGKRLAHKYGVSGYPSMYIVDKIENPLLSSEGYHEAEDLLRLVKSVVKEQK